jgi:hypothetical protein
VSLQVLHVCKFAQVWASCWPDTMGCGGEATEAASTGALIGTVHTPNCCAA